MAKLRGSKIIMEDIVSVMKKIDKKNNGASSFINLAVGICNYLFDNFKMEKK